MQYAYTYDLIPWITILGHSDYKTGITIEFTLKFDAICIYIYPDSRNYHIRSPLIPKWVSQLNLHWNLMQYACTYVLIPEITILGYSNPKRVSWLNSHWNFIYNSKWAHWRVSRVQYSGLHELTGEYPESSTRELTGGYPQSNTQVYMSSLESIQSTILRSMDTLRSSIFNSGMLIGHPPDFNIKLW